MGRLLPVSDGEWTKISSSFVRGGPCSTVDTATAIHVDGVGTNSTIAHINLIVNIYILLSITSCYFRRRNTARPDSWGYDW